MQWFKNTFPAVAKAAHYLANLEWTVKHQPDCKFCKPTTFKEGSIVYEDDIIRAVNNLHPSGEHHWLIMPKGHVRDIENLTSEDLPLLEAMDEVKKHLLQTIASPDSLSSVYSGYHRGRRPLVGDVYWPDIISIHHLHLHVVVRSRFVPKLWKYWNPLFWKSDDTLLRELRRLP